MPPERRTFLFRLTDNTALSAGQYRPLKTRGERNAVLCCPVCERRSTLDHEYLIDDRGRVTPRFVCPYGGDCTFLQTIELEAYPA